MLASSNPGHTNVSLRWYIFHLSHFTSGEERAWDAENASDLQVLRPQNWTGEGEGIALYRNREEIEV
jgi:hypothetical protein